MTKIRRARSRGPYVVGGESFRTQQLLKERIQSILYRYEIGESLDEDDFQFMRDLLERHPERDDKIRLGVADIRIAWSTEYQNRHFQLVRIDGSDTDFSYLECIRPSTPNDNVRGACRRVASEQIREYKKARFRKVDTQGRIPCDSTGELVTMKTAHVDHESPQTFEQLFQGWLQERRLDPEAIATTGHGDNETVLGFADESLATDWAEFHRNWAKLRILSIPANLGGGGSVSSPVK